MRPNNFSLSSPGGEDGGKEAFVNISLLQRQHLSAPIGTYRHLSAVTGTKNIFCLETPRFGGPFAFCFVHFQESPREADSFPDRQNIDLKLGHERLSEVKCG